MKKMFLLALLILCAASPTQAQTGEYNRAEFFAGFSHNRVNTGIQDDDEFFDDDFDETGFAAAIGGGLDVRLNDRVDLRAFQIDYNPTRFFGETQNNVRFGIGVVFH